MKLLIDECLPRKLKFSLSDYEVFTVPEMGWSGKKNGELLRLMVDEFDVFITIDGNLHYQQSMVNFPIAMILLSAPNNKLESLLPLVPQMQECLKIIEKGQMVIIKKRDEAGG
jgi:predicted nuclease of predicted toxin-antitoxin system